MPDLYAVLGAIVLNQPDTPEDERPEPTTALTASVETIDNDYVGGLLQTLAI